MKKLLLLVILLGCSYKASAQIPVTDVAAQGQMITQLVQTLKHIGIASKQLSAITEQTKKIREVMDNVKKVTTIITGVVELTDVLKQTQEIYGMYFAGINEMITGDFPLLDEEVEIYIKLLDAAAFHYDNSEINRPRSIKDIGGGKLKDFEKLLEILKSAKDFAGLDVNALIKESKIIKKEINRTLFRTSSCAKYIRSDITRKKNESGKLEREKLKKAVNKRIKKYKKDFKL